MKKRLRRAFSIIELVIVIAIIAILAAVLIPTFANVVRKANESSDLQLVRNLNTALVTEGGATERFDTAHDAITAVGRAGYDLPKISAAEGENKILWDANYQCFAYYRASSNTIEYVPDTKGEGTDTPNEQLWSIYREMPAAEEQVYSIYWAGDALAEAAVQNVGFDAGYAEVASVTYKGTTSETNEIVIRTNGGTLTVDGESDCVSHYDYVDEVTVIAVAYHSYHEYGTVGRISAEKGRVVLESGSEVESVYVAYANASSAAEEGVKLESATVSEFKVVTDEPANLRTVIENILGEAAADAAAVDKFLPAILVTGQDGSVAAYEDIAEALAKTNDYDTVTLMKNVEYRGQNHGSSSDGLNEYEEYGAYGVKGDNVTIDLNGKMLMLKYQEGGKSAYGSTVLSLNRYETTVSKTIGFENTTCISSGFNVMGSSHGPSFYLSQITDVDGSKTYVIGGITAEEMKELFEIDTSSIEGSLSYVMKWYVYLMATTGMNATGEVYRTKYIKAMGYEDYTAFQEKGEALMEANEDDPYYFETRFIKDIITDDAVDLFVADWTSENTLEQLAEEFMRIFNEEEEGYEFAEDKDYGVSEINGVKYHCLSLGHKTAEQGHATGKFKITLKKTETKVVLPSTITMKNGTIVNELFADRQPYETDEGTRYSTTTYAGTLRFQYEENSKLAFEGVTFKLGGNSAEGYCERRVMSLANGSVAGTLVLTNCKFDENAQISINYNDLDTTGSSGNTYGSTSFDAITPEIYATLYKYVAGGSDGTRPTK